jgi:hypothetical protein
MISDDVENFLELMHHLHSHPADLGEVARKLLRRFPDDIQCNNPVFLEMFACMLTSLEERPEDLDLQLRVLGSFMPYFAFYLDGEVPHLQRVQQAAVTAMNTHQHLDMQCLGCGILGHCFHRDPRPRDTILSAIRPPLLAILNAVRTHERDEAMQAVGLGTIMRFVTMNLDQTKEASTSTCMMMTAVSAFLVEHRIIEIIVRSMQRFSGSLQVQMCGITLMPRFARHTAELWKAHALPVVLQAMTGFANCDNPWFNHLNREGVYANCYAIVYFMYGADCLENAPNPYIRVLSDVMATHTDSANLTYLAFQAIERVASTHKPSKKALGTPEAIRTIVFAMHKHPSDDMVQGMGCCALTSLTQGSQSMKPCFVDAKGFEIVVSTISRDVEHFQTVLDSWELIDCITQDGIKKEDQGFYYKALWRAGGLTAAMKTIKKYQSSQDLLCCSCDVLHSLCMHARSEADYEVKIVQDEAPEAILNVLEAHHDRADMMHALVCCLDIISEMFGILGKEEETETVLQWKRGATRQILACMACHKDNLLLQKISCSALRSHQAFFQEVFDQADGVRIVVGTMNSHPGDLEVQSCALRLLSVCTSTRPSLQDQCFEHGAIDAAVRAIKVFKDDKNFVQWADSCILHMTHKHEANTSHAIKTVPKSHAKQVTDARTEEMINMMERIRNTDEVAAHTASLSEESRAEVKAFWSSISHGVVRDLGQEDVFVRMVTEREKRIAEEVCAGCGRTAREAEVAAAGEAGLKPAGEAGLKPAGEAGLKRLSRCSACTVAPCYCSSECQRACWPAHKAECKANRKPA